MGFSPIISLINTLYLLYYRKPVYNKLNYILSLFVILGLTSFIEFTTGHIFVLFVILTQVYIEYNKANKKINNEIDFFEEGNKISFFIGCSSIVGILLVENTIIKICLLAARIGIYFIFKYMKNNTTDKNKIDLINEYQHYYLVGTILPIMVLMWGQYEKAPDIKYIKLFYRR